MVLTSIMHVSHTCTCLLPILVPARLHKLFGSGSALNDAEVGISQHVVYLSLFCCTLTNEGGTHIYQ